MGKGHKVVRAERITPTEETLAKLQPDPLQTMIALFRDIGTRTSDIEDAANEIRIIYSAVCRALMSGEPPDPEKVDGGGNGGISPTVAWWHSQTYVPWTRTVEREAMEAIIDIVVERRVIASHLLLPVSIALTNYAARRSVRRPPPEEKT